MSAKGPGLQNVFRVLDQKGFACVEKEVFSCTWVGNAPKGRSAQLSGCMVVFRSSPGVAGGA